MLQTRRVDSSTVKYNSTSQTVVGKPTLHGNKNE